MARTTSPRPSPGLGPRTYGRSPSPASAQPTNKKERKRMQISERLAAMHNSFEQNHTDHYWAQLSAVQCEINLLMRADPYREGPLDDSPEGVAQLMAEARKEVCSARPIAPEAEASFQHTSGKFYPEFVREVNTALEQRDADLASIHNNYRNSLSDLNRQKQYAIQLAQSEGDLLVSTLRDRIIQQLVSNRTRLLREKEQLDIADSNALLLNPSQFSIGNPASPGGALNPRKTRNTRHRPGEGDEPASLVARSEEHKRKRKAAFDNDNENGSPGPSNRNNASENALAPTSAPFKDAKQKLVHAQFEAPLYSVERLFTEKDLLLNMNRAHLMTAEYFARLRAQGIESRLQTAAIQHQAASVNGGGTDDINANAESISMAGADKEKQGETEEGQREEDQELGQSSQMQAPVNTHATRSTQRAAAAAANPLNALSDLATAAASTTSALPSTSAVVTSGLAFGSNAPSSLPPYTLSTTAVSSKSNPSAPPPPGATDAEIAHDMLMMKRGTEDPRYEETLKRSTERPGVGTGLAFAGAQGTAAASAVRDENVGGVDMVRGNSSFGGVAMSRGASLNGYGGVDMRRTGSARG